MSVSSTVMDIFVVCYIFINYLLECERNMLKPVIYLDLDGVLADFEGWAATTFGDWRKEIDSPQWGRFGEFQNLFELLPLMEGAVELYQTCVEVIGDKNQVQILTALPNRAEISMPDAAKY